MPKGYLMFVLHAHLPFVHHPEYEWFLEERWLFEAITETYIPLIKFFDRLHNDEVAFRVTLSMSPTLCAMLESPMLQQRYERHLELMMRLCDAEIQRTRDWPEVHRLALMYRTLMEEARVVFVERAHKNLLDVFRGYQEDGEVELITCAGTHPYLPGFTSEPETVRAHVLTAVHEHERLFGRKPKGIWLPECGYFAGLDPVLLEAGIRYTFVDSHGIDHADPRPMFGPAAPIYCPSGMAVFARHPATSRLVWSSTVGYPSDPNYRDYYRDIGFDLTDEYLAPYQYGTGVRIPTGIKYHRITGAGTHKDIYDPDRGRETAERHAHNFIAHCRDLASRDAVRMPHPSVLVSPYDAELFGHWWFEGPQWLHYVLREAATSDNDAIRLITPSEYLEKCPVHQIGSPSPSSWGHKGYGEHWLNDRTAWIWRPLHQAYCRMQSAVETCVTRQHDPVVKRTLQQAARELMLAQSSDWPFAITNATTEAYAKRRLLDHLARFHELMHQLDKETVDLEVLTGLEHMDAIFPEVDYRLFGRSDAEAALDVRPST